MREFFMMICILAGAALGALVLMIPIPSARILLAGVAVLPAIVGALTIRRRAAGIKE